MLEEALPVEEMLLLVLRVLVLVLVLLVRASEAAWPVRISFRVGRLLGTGTLTCRGRRQRHGKRRGRGSA